jgi:hypothetical protein
MTTSKTTRRSILAGAAALPAFAVSGMAAGISTTDPDPVLGILARLKVLSAAWTKTVKQEPPFGSPATEAWDVENATACHAYNDALDELISTKPTTHAGAVAMIAYCLKKTGGRFGDDESDDHAASRALLKTLAAAIPTLKAA